MKNNFDVLNRFFDKKTVLRQRAAQWFKPSYGKTFLRTMLNLGREKFDGIVMPHLAVPYRKSDIERVWVKCGNILEKVQYNRFRDNTDLSHFLYRYWRLCVGDYYPRVSKGLYISLEDISSAQKAAQVIRKQKEPVICINDCWEGMEYQEAKNIINSAFKDVLREKCEFEK